tara:strand:- start:2005 stop:2217 length:213 start_codon:yes stop_codon:yes gene_type:complete
MPIVRLVLSAKRAFASKRILVDNPAQAESNAVQQQKHVKRVVLILTVLLISNASQVSANPKTLVASLVVV